AKFISGLQALSLAHEEKFIRTPTYHFFEMYAAHQGGQSVRCDVSSPRLSYARNGKPATMRGLNGSASLRDRQLILTVTNPDPSAAKETQIAVRGAAIQRVRVSSL